MIGLLGLECRPDLLFWPGTWLMLGSRRSKVPSGEGQLLAPLFVLLMYELHKGLVSVNAKKVLRDDTAEA